MRGHSEEMRAIGRNGLRCTRHKLHYAPFAESLRYVRNDASACFVQVVQQACPAGSAGILKQLTGAGEDNGCEHGISAGCASSWTGALPQEP